MADLFHTPLLVLHILTCIVLVIVVLVQPGRSGGLGAFSGAAAQQVFGGRGAGNVLTKITWSAAGIFFTTAVTLAYLDSSTADSLANREKPEEKPMLEAFSASPGAEAPPASSSK